MKRNTKSTRLYNSLVLNLASLAKKENNNTKRNRFKRGLEIHRFLAASVEQGTIILPLTMRDVG